jgi:hypothetical protein
MHKKLTHLPLAALERRGIARLCVAGKEYSYVITTRNLVCIGLDSRRPLSMCSWVRPKMSSVRSRRSDVRAQRRCLHTASLQADDVSAGTAALILQRRAGAPRCSQVVQGADNRCKVPRAGARRRCLYLSTKRSAHSAGELLRPNRI